MSNYKPPGGGTKSNSSVNDVLMGNSKQLAMRPKLEELTTTTDLAKFSASQQLELFEQLNNYVKTSNMKSELKPLVGLMLETIKAQHAKVRKLTDQVKAAANGNPINQASHQNNTYSTYSNCVKNKPIEHPVIIKVADSVKDKESIDLKKVVFDQLKPVKSKIDVMRVNRSRDSLILKVRDSEQQALMIESLKSHPTVQADKPRERVPSILIAEIEKEPGLDTKEKIEKHIMSELVANEGVKEENCKIKVTMCNPKFHTIRCIINFDSLTTKAVLSKGHVKIGYKICPVSKTIRVIQCSRCLKFGHFEKNKDGTTACRSKSPSCNFCAGDHAENQCTKDKNRPENKKCLNCSKNHTADYRGCESRVAREKELLSRCSC